MTKDPGERRHDVDLAAAEHDRTANQGETFMSGKPQSRLDKLCRKLPDRAARSGRAIPSGGPGRSGYSR